MTAITTPDLFKAYLAYFGRPPDVGGITAYTTDGGGVGQSPEAVYNGFSASAESQAFFGSMPLTQQLDQIYHNLFNRPIEAAGLVYWSARVQGDTIDPITGNVVPQLNLAEAAIGILNGAQNGDLDTVNAKLAVMERFVFAMDTPAEWNGYVGNEAAADARAFIATVGADSVVSDAQIDAAVLVATTPNAPPEPTWDITNAPTVNEGSAVTFTIQTTNVAANTIYSYEISGITSDDLQGGALIGNVIIDATGQALVQVNVKADSLTEGNETMTLKLGDGLAVASVVVIDTSTTPVLPPVVGVVEVATPGIDILTGTSADDLFVATNSTLQAGDVFNGLAGNDRLNISFSGNSNSYYDGFETNSIETISVKNLANGAVSLDVSDVNYDTTNGAVNLQSRESGNNLTFWDIQSINNTDLQIVDTEYDTFFWYDAGSSAVNDNGDGTQGDVAEIQVGEMRGQPNFDGSNWYSGGFGTGGGNDGARPGVDGAGVYLGNTDNFGYSNQSYVDVIRLQSGVTGQTSPTLKNTIELTAGEDLDTLVITGAADLEITNTLDPNIRFVDASKHQALLDSAGELVLDVNGKAQFSGSGPDARADLILDLSNSSDGILFADQSAYWTDDANEDGYVSGDPEDQVEGLVDVVKVKGSQGDDLINFAASVVVDGERISLGGTHNDKEVDLGAGNDTLVAAGWIHQPDLSESQSLQIDGGQGNDGPAEPARHPEFSILWGGEAVVDGGSGNDVIFTGNLNDSVVGGDGNDIIFDGGSTSWNTRNTNYFHGEEMHRYDPDYVDYGNWFDLGKGNDALTVYSAPNLLGDVGALEDRQIVAGSNDTVFAGEGNDVVTIYGSAIDGFIQPLVGNVWDKVTTKVDLGDGNDGLSVGDSGSREGYRGFGELVVDYGAKDAGVHDIAAWGGSRGDVSVEGGADTDDTVTNNNDTITIWRDGTHTVNSGSGDDSVAIHGDENEFSSDHWDGTARDGAHQVNLGAGNDNLWITGRAEVDLRTVVTNIDAGSGNDFVQIDQDHRMSVKLGEGADTLMLRAQDLQSNDTVQGGDNYLTDTVNDLDRIILTNETHNIFTGEVRDSETRHVFSVEEFWLLDSNIRLHITDNLVATALNNKVVVDTTLAERGQFPVELGQQVGGPRYQGMTWQMWDKVNPNPDFLDINIVQNDAIPGASNGDLVYFVYKASDIPTQTVDLTKLNTVDYTFELRGGGLRDLVIVDEDALSQDLVLNFDAGGGSSEGSGDQFQGWSKSDTLQIIDGATVRAADMENVNELEIIDLVASSNIAQVWTIELNNHVINQPTGTADLTIRIDPNVPAGSKVYVVMSENNTNLATNNVIVERNSNVQVYISTDPGNPWASAVLVTEPQYNTMVANFNGSGFGVYVKTDQFFTTNADNLPGTSGDDLYIAQTLDVVQSGDIVNGGDGFDTVQLNFAVAAQANTLQDQLENATLNDVEQIRFATENNVQMRYIGGAFAPDLTHLTTGIGNDRLELMERDGLTFTLNEGDDYVSFSDLTFGASASVIGGAGSDTVVGTRFSDDFHLGGVEFVDLGSGNDQATFDLLGGNAGNTTVLGGSGNDIVRLDADGTDLNSSVQGTMSTYDVESVVGGAGLDRINAYQSAGNLMVWGGNSGDAINAWGTSSTSVSVWGEAGNDTINVDTSTPVGGYGNSNNVYVNGGSGIDVINVGLASPDHVTVLGGTENDTITVHADHTAWIEGNADSDVINVTIGSAGGHDTVGSSVWGDSAAGADSVGSADIINVVVADSVTVYGGGGDDLITVDSSAGSGGSTYIFGQDGSDTINVKGDAATFINAGGDNSNDVINLQDVGSNIDTIVFGNINYGPLQQQVLNTQGVDVIHNFNFEVGSDSVHPQSEDVLNFDAFLNYGSNDFNSTMSTAPGSAIKFADWTSGVNSSVDVDNYLIPGSDPANPLTTPVDAKVVVLNVANGFDGSSLKNALVLDTNREGYGGANGLHMDDGSRTVVILAKDSVANPLVGYDTFEVYYVQDVDSSSASAVWAVDLVATIHSTTAIGSTSGSIQVGNNIIW